MNQDELDVLIKNMTQVEASKAVQIMYAAKDEHRATCWKEYGKYIKCFEDAYDLLSHTVLDINYIDKKSWSTSKALQYFFYPGMLKTSFRAFEDIQDGYYEEAMMLLRSVYEALLRIVFLSCYPQDWKGAVNVTVEAGARQFNVTNFTKQELRIDWDLFYRLPSYSQHGRKQDVISFLAAAGRGENTPVFFTHEYDGEKVTLPLNYSVFTMWLMLRYMLILFPDAMNHPKIKPEMKKRWEDTEKAFEGIIACAPNAYAQTVKDVHKIERILKAAAAGQDWTVIAREEAGKAPLKDETSRSALPS